MFSTDHRPPEGPENGPWGRFRGLRRVRRAKSAIFAPGAKCHFLAPSGRPRVGPEGPKMGLQEALFGLRTQTLAKSDIFWSSADQKRVLLARFDPANLENRPTFDKNLESSSIFCQNLPNFHWLAAQNSGKIVKLSKNWLLFSAKIRKFRNFGNFSLFRKSRIFSKDRNLAKNGKFHDFRQPVFGQFYQF